MTYQKDRDLAARWGVCRTTPWEWVKTKPDFPQPIKLSERCTRWKLSDVETWEAAQSETAD